MPTTAHPRGPSSLAPRIADLQSEITAERAYAATKAATGRHRIAKLSLARVAHLEGELSRLEHAAANTQAPEEAA